MTTTPTKKKAPALALVSFVLSTAGILLLVKVLRYAHGDSRFAAIPLVLVTGFAVAASLFALVGSFLAVLAPPAEGGSPTPGRPH